MSSFADDVANEVASAYCIGATTTLVAFEYFLHLPREAEYFWKRRFTGASALFLSNRYLTLLSQAIQLANPTSEKRWEYSPNSCSMAVNAMIVITILPYIPWAVFSSLQTYALCKRRTRLPVALLVLLLSSLPIGFNFANTRWSSTFTDPILGCVEDLSAEPAAFQKYCSYSPLSSWFGSQLNRSTATVASRTSLIVADLIVLGVTWRATYRDTRLARVAGEKHSQRTFSGTLLRDGTIYFLIIVTLNVLQLLFTMLSISLNSLSSISNITAFTDPITSILVSRFILNLQEVEHDRANPHLSSFSSGQDSFNFASLVIGSLGVSLPSPGDTSLEDERLNFGFDDGDSRGDGQDSEYADVDIAGV